MSYFIVVRHVRGVEVNLPLRPWLEARTLSVHARFIWKEWLAVYVSLSSDYRHEAV